MLKKKDLAILLQKELSKKSEISMKSEKGSALVKLLVFIFLIALTVYCVIISYNFTIKSQTQKQSSIIEETDPKDAITVDIPLGSGTDRIIEILSEKKIIKYPVLFKILSKIIGYDGVYLSGTHLLKSHTDYNSIDGYETIMRVLASKPLDNPSMDVTFPEGLTYLQTVKVLTDKNIISSDKFLAECNADDLDFKFIKTIPATRKFKLEGYLFPETYKFDIKAGEKEMIKKMLRQFDKIFKPEYYLRAEELKMSVDDIIILASIIEKETNKDDERDIVASVFYNRLYNKDKTLRKLQSCATIQYIYLNETGIVKKEITTDDTKIDNPYNTYLTEGLPPGPICNPGEKSILAALYPEETEYLYFVAKGDGTHYFSKTYREHVNASNKYGQNLP